MRHALSDESGDKYTFSIWFTAFFLYSSRGFGISHSSLKLLHVPSTTCTFVADLLCVCFLSRLMNYYRTFSQSLYINCRSRSLSFSLVHSVWFGRLMLESLCFLVSFFSPCDNKMPWKITMLYVHQHTRTHTLWNYNILALFIHLNGYLYVLTCVRTQYRDH